MHMRQHTLKRSYIFEGKGLHTGRIFRMAINPAPEGAGIRFCRTDKGGVIIEALADYVTSTARSTTIEKDGVAVITIEHLMSALYGLGVDNAFIEINGDEVPILDGSAKPYIDAISADGLMEQEALREYYNLDEEIHVTDAERGSEIIFYPAPETSFDVTVDYNSKVLGVQTAHWDPAIDYACEVGTCRTFVFFHEIAFLFSKNLIKGGDVDNAIVIVEHPVVQDELDRMAALFNMPRLVRNPDGYLNNVVLRYPNECARHKLLDLMGDLALVGRRVKARVVATRPGHGINTKAARILRDKILNDNK